MLFETVLYLSLLLVTGSRLPISRDPITTTPSPVRQLNGEQPTVSYQLSAASHRQQILFDDFSYTGTSNN